MYVYIERAAFIAASPRALFRPISCRREELFIGAKLKETRANAKRAKTAGGRKKMARHRRDRRGDGGERGKKIASFSG